MGMFVFLLVALFWVGAFAAAKTGIGLWIAMASSMVLGMIGSTIGRGIPLAHFQIIMMAFFVVSALATAVSGFIRATEGRQDAWTMFSWSASFVAFPLVVWRSFETLIQAWP